MARAVLSLFKELWAAPLESVKLPSNRFQHHYFQHSNRLAESLMQQQLGSLKDVLCLRTVAAAGTFNIFFGAGISRDPPSNGPIWNEMQVGLLSAMFDRMARAGWSIASEFPKDRASATTVDTRPETFWRRILEPAGEALVTQALTAAHVGLPNRNHRLMAELLASGICSQAFTTNFDEHLESVLPESFPTAVPVDDGQLSDVQRARLIKLHGTIGSPKSLVFTLEQYDQLDQRNRALLARLSTAPLLIAGYSGYDTDVLPGLSAIVSQTPFTVIVKHPGSSPGQPVFRLAAERSNVFVLESTFEAVLSELSVGISSSNCRYPNTSTRTDQGHIYMEASETVPIYRIPFILTSVFNLGGCWKEGHKYAWLTHDACCDAREDGTITPMEFRTIHLDIAYVLKLCGDSFGSRSMLGAAKRSVEDNSGSASEMLAILRAQALIENTPSQQSSHSDREQPSKLEKLQPSQLVSAIDSWRDQVLLAGPSDPHGQFISIWQRGLVLGHEGRFAAAIETYDAGLPMISSCVATHLERGRFLLDYGGVLFKYAVQNESPEVREKANTVYQLSEAMSEEVGDWPTCARARLMLSKIYLGAGLIERAREYVASTLEAAARTNDPALRSRIQEFIAGLNAITKLRNISD